MIFLNRKRKRMAEMYRRVFNTPEGRIVFQDILNRGGFWNDIQNEEQRIRYNFAMELLDVGGFRVPIDWSRQTQVILTIEPIDVAPEQGLENE